MASPSASPVAFSVRRSQPQLIVPAVPTPHEQKQLSDIDDQQGLRFQIPFLIFYRNHPSLKGKDPLSIIREALGKALVFYYPFAGRLIEGPNGKLVVDCTGEGILFIEADADVTIDQLGDTIQPPCPYTDEFLYDVPGSSSILGCPLLLIQVTRLACGGLVLAIRLNHPMSDSLGLAKFLNTVGEFARGERNPSLLPVWKRDILSARNPPRVTCVHHEFDETTTTNISLDQGSNMVHRSFFFGPRELKAIRKHIPPHLQKCSNFEVLTSCIWRCRALALQLDPKEDVRLSCVINARGKQGLVVPPGYYGNAFAYPAAISRAGLLCASPLGYALELVRRLKTQMNEEYIKSVADLMVIKERPHYATGSNFVVVDLSRSGLGEVDLGWGKPIYGGATGALPYFSIYGRFKNSIGVEGIVFPIWLLQPVMERFQQEVLKMTQESSTDDSYGFENPRTLAFASKL